MINKWNFASHSLRSLSLFLFLSLSLSLSLTFFLDYYYTKILIQCSDKIFNNSIFISDISNKFFYNKIVFGSLIIISC